MSDLPTRPATDEEMRHLARNYEAGFEDGWRRAADILDKRADELRDMYKERRRPDLSIEIVNGFEMAAALIDEMDVEKLIQEIRDLIQD